MEQENKQPSPGEILIIDDTLASLQLLADLLGEAGYAVRTAQDGEMGLLSAQAQAPDLILLDIRMPGMDGFEVCRRLKADPATAEVPIIFLSALQDTQNKMQGFQLGAVDYITKPYQASEVLARVRTHVELHQLQTVLKNKVVFRTMKLEQEIAEHKQTEAALSESEQRYRLLVESSPFCIHEIGLDGRLLSMNKAGLDMLGLDDEKKICGAPYLSAVGEQDAKRIEMLLNEAVLGKPSHFEFVSSGGKPSYFKSCFIPIKDAGGNVTKLMGITEDITQRKQTEEELRRNESNLNEAQRIAHIGSWQWDVITNTASWSTETYRIFGIPSDRLEEHRQNFIDMIHPDDRARVDQALNDALKGVKEYNIEYRIILKDKSEKIIHALADVLRNDQGMPVMMHGTVHDITKRKHAEEALRVSEARLRLSVEAASVGLWDWDLQTNETYFSPEWKRQIGYRDEEIGNDLKEWQSRVHPDDLDSTLQKINAYLAKPEGKHEVEFRFRHKDGSYRWIYTQADVLCDANGKPIHMLGCHIDITERKRAEEALRLQSEITANAAEGIALIKAGDGIIHYANRQFEMLFGYEQGELTGKHISIINAPTEKSPQEIAAEIIRKIEEQGMWSGEVQNRKKDGAVLWTSANVSTFQHPELGTLMITYQRDITEKKRTEETVWKQANFDALTGLPNRHMFQDRLAQEIRKANRASQQIALMFIDLDRFKEVNDTLGHDMGDALLVEAAHRIGESVRATDMVARMGGDEFTVTLTDVVDVGSIERVAQSILLKLAEPFHLGTEIAYVSGSVGITLYPDDAASMEELLKNADQAMYVAKSLGRNRHSYFTHELQVAAQTRMNLISDLRGALTSNQFRVYFQPIVDMATGAIHKAEALIRWQHPQRGLVSPQEFIPLAEETGLIFEIGDWVFHESANWVKRWRKLHHAEFQVSVNKSPVQFYKMGDKDSAWLAHLRDLELPGQSIVIEITEGLLLGAESAIGDALFTLRDAGIQIAIDDFGTGYSSLAYLNRFNIDYLKIDQSFTRNLTPESNDMALSEAIIVMAHKLGLKVIAEGVETQMQRDLLAAVGCDYAQGYLYSRPVPPEEFEMLLKNSATKVQ